MPERSSNLRINYNFLGGSAISKVIIVIPARYASTRLPAKPLLNQSGKYLIQHVYEGASLARRAQEVIVATDDERIRLAVLSFGGKVEMTDIGHKSGTDRIAEVISRHACDIVINVQGDEPEISPQAVDQLILLMEEHPDIPVGTLATPVSPEEAQNPNLVKVVCNKNGHALYFSRSRIPYPRDPNQAREVKFLGHLGIYGYRQSFLSQYSSLPPSQLEDIEKLEQLRVLENGFAILVGITSYRSRGIDTMEDYQQFLERFRKQKR
jgi:3-deoxy-manno-octulosonate cytidylyltransferase (CMP-KDO synthetase)